MTKAENSRVAQSNEPSADRIAADLAIVSPGAGNALSSANLGGGNNDKPAAPICYSCGHANCSCTDWAWA